MRTLFWAVDCQNDFMLPTGALYVPGAYEIIPKIEGMSDFASENRITVVNTMDCHTPNSKELSATPDYKTTFPQHCMMDEEGQELIDEAYVTDLPHKMAHLPRKSYTVQYGKPFNREAVYGVNHVIIEKDDIDVFKGNEHTKEIVRLLSPELVVVYGVASDFCVNAAVLGLAEICEEVVVAIDAIAAVDSDSGKAYARIQNWLYNGAWLASCDHIKRHILNDRKCYV